MKRLAITRRTERNGRKVTRSGSAAASAVGKDFLEHIHLDNFAERLDELL